MLAKAVPQRVIQIAGKWSHDFRCICCNILQESSYGGFSPTQYYLIMFYKHNPFRGDDYELSKEESSERRHFTMAALQHVDTFGAAIRKVTLR